MTVHLAAGDADATGWCQLTYTSADLGTGVLGGWGVKEVGGAPGQTSLDLMRSGVTTTLDVADPLPDFPSTAQLDARDRRLLCRVVDDQVVLWHAVAAGSDATGRPGNVFNHVAVGTGGQTVVRPIDYWRSPDWLTPFGPVEVNSASLPTGLHVGSAVGVEQVVDYVQSARQRRFSLEWILAACAHVLDTDATLVLGVADPDEAAQWIGALSHLTGPAQARRISWLTFERGTAVATARAEGLTLLFVPRADLDDARAHAPADALVLDAAAMPEEDGDSWVLGPLRFPGAPEWQNAMLDVFARSRRDAASVMRRADDFVQDLSVDEAEILPLGWSLWMSLLDAVTPVAQRPARAAYCLRWAPASQHDSPPVLKLVKEVSDDEQAADELRDAPRGVRALVDRHRVTAYVSGGWHDQPPPETLDVPSADLLTGISLSPVLVAGVAALQDPHVERVSAAVRLIGFVTVRLGTAYVPAAGVDAPSGAEALAAAVERLADPGLPLSEEERSTLLDGLRPAEPEVPSSPEQTGPVSTAPEGMKGAPWTLHPQVLVQEPPPLRAAAPDPVRLVQPGDARTDVVLTRPDAPARPGERSAAGGSPASAGGWLSQTVPVKVAVNRLHDYLATQGNDPARARAVADTVLVVAGVDDVPLRATSAVRQQAYTVEEIMTGVDVHPLLERQALRWLLCYWTLAELGLLADGSPAAAPESVRRRAAEADNRTVVHVELHALGLAMPEVLSGYKRVQAGGGRYPFAASLLTTTLADNYRVGALALYAPKSQEE